MKWICFFLFYTTALFPAENAWKGKIYSGDFHVEIASDYESINVEITTDDLKLRPVCWDDFSNYAALFSDPEVMEKYCDGIPWSAEQLYPYLRKWIWRWEKGADPYSAFAIFNRDGEFVGHILLDHGFQKGEARLEFLFRKEFWDRGFAKQATSVILKGYATYLSELGFYVNLNDSIVPAAPLRNVYANVRIGAPFAEQVLIRSGMRHADEEISNGIFYKVYKISLHELILLDRKWSAQVDSEREWGIHSPHISRQ